MPFGTYKTHMVITPQIYTPGNFYYQPYPSWGLYHSADQLHSSKERNAQFSMAVGTFNPVTAAVHSKTSLPLWYENVSLPSLQYYAPPISAIGCSCFQVAASRKYNLNWWTGIGENQEYWTDWVSYPWGCIPCNINIQSDPSSFDDGAGNHNGKYSGLRSAFLMPPNPMIVFSLAHKPSADLAGKAPCVEILIESIDGSGKISLVVGEDGAWQCFFWHPDFTNVSGVTKWKHAGNSNAEGKLSMGRMEQSGGAGDWPIFWLWAMPGMVCLSQDSFQGNMLMWELPTTQGDEYDPYGWLDKFFVGRNTVTFRSNIANQWGFQFFVVDMAGDIYNNAYIYSPVEWAPASWVTAHADGALMMIRQRGLYTVDGTGTPIPGQVTLSIPGLGGEPLNRARPESQPDDEPPGPTIEWKAKFNPYNYTTLPVFADEGGHMSVTAYGDGDAFPRMKTAQAIGAFHAIDYTALVHEIYMQRPAPQPTLVTAPPTLDTRYGTGTLIKSLQISEDGINPICSTTGSIELDAGLGNADSIIANPGRRRTFLNASWYAGVGTPMTASDSCLFGGWMDEFTTTSVGVVQTIVAKLYDDLSALSDYRNMGDLPSFAAWNPLDAIANLLRSFGIPYEWFGFLPTGWRDPDPNGLGRGNFLGLEDLNMVLPYGTLGKPLWTCRSGEQIIRLIEEMLEYTASAGMWVDRATGIITTGCPYCRRRRSNVDEIDGEPNPHYWWQHIYNGPASAGCLVADIERSGNALGVDHWLWTHPVGMVNAIGDAEQYGDVFEFTSEPMVPLESRITTVSTTAAKPRYGTSDSQFGFYAENSPRVRADPGVSSGNPYEGCSRVDIKDPAWCGIEHIAKRYTYVRYDKSQYVAPYYHIRTAWNPLLAIGNVVALYGVSALWGLQEGQKYRIVKLQGSVDRRRGNMQYADLTVVALWANGVPLEVL